MGRTINEVDKTLLIIVLKFSNVYNTKRYFNKIYNITTVIYIYIYMHVFYELYFPSSLWNIANDANSPYLSEY